MLIRKHDSSIHFDEQKPAQLFTSTETENFSSCQNEVVKRFSFAIEVKGIT
jgi:hypothetical protein